jgi:hypothetical protein
MDRTAKALLLLWAVLFVAATVLGVMAGRPWRLVITLAAGVVLLLAAVFGKKKS